MATARVKSGGLGRWGLLVLLALAGCGGGGGGGESGTAGPEAQVISGNFMPLAVGDRWIYSWNGAAEATAGVVGTRTAEGQSGWVVQTMEPVGNAAETVYLVSADRVRAVPVYSPDPLVTALGAVDVMRMPLRAGDEWTQADKTVDLGLDLDGDLRNETAQVRSVVRVIGLESVDTPSGTLSGTLHQRTVLTATVVYSRSGSSATSVSTTDEWYAPNLGPVRIDSVIRSGDQVQQQSIAVSAYHVGDVRSESQPPTLQSTDPASDAQLPAVSRVTLTFSEAVDAAAARAAISVVDALGGEVGGTVTLGNSDERQVIWTPAQALADGGYTVRVGVALTDRLGNAMAAAMASSFTVDSTAPGLLSSTPANGATDAPRDQPIVLRFNEVLDPASVNASSVIFSGGAATLSVAGDTLTVTPSATLQRLTDYTVQVTPLVTDRAGNAMPGAVIGFRTDSGRFAPSSALPAIAAAGYGSNPLQVVATGDVNGDGRADVLGAAYDGSFWPGRYALAIWYQQADGRLAPPELLTLPTVGPAGGCDPSSIGVGDLDGDGRLDLAIASNGCGVQLVFQTAGGALALGPLLDTLVSGLLRLADVDGDGRLDIVSLAAYGTRVQVWRQGSAGVFSLVAEPAAATSLIIDLAVGDLNGDGRPDLAVSGVNQPGHSMAVLYQLPDGSFAAPAYQTLQRQASGVAIGDVNGDGRQDLVYTVSSNAPAYLGVMLQQADGSLAAPQWLDSYDIPQQIVAADVNGDGRTDLVVAHSGWQSVGVYLQGTDGRLGAESRYRATTNSWLASAMAVGDVSGDGRPDIVLPGEVLIQRPVPVQSQSLPPWLMALRVGAGAASR